MFLFGNPRRPGFGGAFLFQGLQNIRAGDGTNCSPANWELWAGFHVIDFKERLQPLPLDLRPDQRLYVAESHLQRITSAFGFTRTGFEETP
jgi:hypothetical protein